MGLALAAQAPVPEPELAVGRSHSSYLPRRLHALLAAVCLAFLGPSQTVLHRFYERVSQSL